MKRATWPPARSKGRQRISGAPAADRIDQQAHLHALAGPAGEEADEFAADLVRREDVSGDMDSAAGGEDLGAQGLERVAAMPVAQQADGVAGRDRAFAEAQASWRTSRLAALKALCLRPPKRNSAKAVHLGSRPASGTHRSM